MQYIYRIRYYHPRSGLAGVSMLHTVAEKVVERARLQALGYSMDETLMPIAEGPHLPSYSSSR